MSGKKPGTGLITLQRGQWAYLTVMVLLIGPFSMAVAHADEVYAAYVRTYVAPEVRRRFGFRMERERMYFREWQPLDVYVITATEPDGVLARAGVVPDDVPVGAYHWSDVGFYNWLRESRRGPVGLYLVNRDRYRDWLKTGDSPLSERWRKVVIPRQPARCLAAPGRASPRTGAKRNSAARASFQPPRKSKSGARPNSVAPRFCFLLTADRRPLPKSRAGSRAPCPS